MTPGSAPAARRCCWALAAAFGQFRSGDASTRRYSAEIRRSPDAWCQTPRSRRHSNYAGSGGGSAISSGSGRGRSSRRGFLKGVGAAGQGSYRDRVGAGPATADPAPGPLAPRLQARAGEGAPARSVELGRIFPALPPFAEASDKVRAVLVDLGSPGGIMDAGDQLSAGPKALIVDPTVNGNPTAKIPTGRTLTTPTMTAGSTFVGQFTDHDITFDQTSQLGVPQNPAGVAQHPHAGARPRLGVRRRPGPAPRPTRSSRSSSTTASRTSPTRSGTATSRTTRRSTRRSRACAPALARSDPSDIASVYAAFATPTPLWTTSSSLRDN